MPALSRGNAGKHYGRADTVGRDKRPGPRAYASRAKGTGLVQGQSTRKKHWTRGSAPSEDLWGAGLLPAGDCRAQAGRARAGGSLAASSGKMKNGLARCRRTNPSHNIRSLRQHPRSCQEQNEFETKKNDRAWRPRRGDRQVARAADEPDYEANHRRSKNGRPAGRPYMYFGVLRAEAPFALRQRRHMRSRCGVRFASGLTAQAGRA
jgi:hypothetical protein